MDDSPKGLDDPDQAAHAWGRYRNLLAWMILAAAICAAAAITGMAHLQGPLHLVTMFAILGNDPVPVVTIRRGATVAQAVELLATHRIGAVPVMEGETVAGILSERDVVRLLAQDRAALDGPVDSVMTAPAITVGRAEPVIGALSLMTRRRIRHLPVVEDGRLIGLVSIGDLVKYRIDRIETEAAAMRDYIQSA